MRVRTRVKICGITRPEDAIAAAAAGADAIGLVFCAASPRHIAPERAREIVAALPPLVSTVALFLDPARDEVARVLDAVEVDLLQFHGRESPEFCESFGRRYLKALGMGGGSDTAADAAAHPHATGFLLDSHVPGAQGGSGETFDWSRIPVLPKPYLLAGGLSPANVAEAVRRCRPYGVDVSSGVESAKGIKDAAKIAAFIDEVNRVQDH